MDNIKVLIVDDDLNVRKLLHDFLSFYGYQVDCAINGLDALEMIKNKHYNLLIVDYQMPKLNGLEFVKKFRDKWTSTPIFAMSASNESDIKELFLKAGADFFILKPIELKSLKKEIELRAIKIDTKD